MRVVRRMWVAFLFISLALTLAASGPPGGANQGLAWNTSVDPTLETTTWTRTLWESTLWESTYIEPAAYEFLD